MYILFGNLGSLTNRAWKTLRQAHLIASGIASPGQLTADRPSRREHPTNPDALYDRHSKCSVARPCSPPLKHGLPLFYERPRRFLEVFAVLRLPLHRSHPCLVPLRALQAQLVDEEL